MSLDILTGEMQSLRGGKHPFEQSTAGFPGIDGYGQRRITGLDTDPRMWTICAIEVS